MAILDDVTITSGTVTAGPSTPTTRFALGSSFTFRNGTVDGAFEITVVGNLNWDGGTMAANLTLGAGGAGTFGLFTTRFIGEGATVRLGADTEWTGGAILGRSGAVLDNDATLTATGTATTLGRAANNLAVAPRFDNDGAYVYDADRAQTNSFALDNGGTVEVVRGATRWAAGGAGSGDFDVAAGAELEFALGTFDLSAATFAVAGTADFGGTDIDLSAATIAGDGTVDFGATVAPALGGSYDLAGGTTRVTGGSVAFGPGVLASAAALGDVLDLDAGTVTVAQDVTVATLDAQNGVLAGAGSVTATDALVWNGGELAADVTLGPGGAGTFGLFTTRFIGEGATVRLGADTEWTGGAILGRSGAVLDNDATLTATGTATTLGRAANNLAVAPRFDNDGAYVYDADRAQTNSFALDNGGTVEVVRGATRWSSEGTNDGTVQIADGAEFELSQSGSSVFTNAAGGVIGGDGTFDEPSQPASFVNEGTFSPGAALGTLAYQGDYAMNEASTTVLAVEIEGPTVGTDYDQLAVDGDVALGGTLGVTVDPGYDPTIGESFDVLTWTGSRTGTFTSTQGLTLPNNKRLDPVFAGDRLTLVVVSDGVANVPPDADDDAFTVLEDATDVPLDVLDNDIDGDDDPLALAIVAGPSNGTSSVSDSGTPGDLTDDVILYTPDADFFGSDSITYSVDDGNGGTDQATVTITVAPVNDEPSFTIIDNPDQTVRENAGAQTVPGFVTGFTPGPANEAGQSPIAGTFSDVPDLIQSLSIDPATGDLTYTPRPNAVGTTTVSVSLLDDGGTDNGGDNTSPPQTFEITITPVNDAPTFALLGDQTVADDAGPQTVDDFAFNVDEGGGTDEDDQTVTFDVSNDDNALFSSQPAINADGTLTYTPQPGQGGVATVTVVATDDGGTDNGGEDTSAPQTFTITVTSEQADLALAKTVSAGTAPVGSQVTFVVTLTNGGPDEATGIVVSDPEPAGLTFGTVTEGQGTYDAGTGLWTVGTLAAGGSTTLTVVATVDATGTKTNVATVQSSDVGDSDPENDAASASVTGEAVPSADLAVIKTGSPAAVQTGEPFSFVVTLTNDGPSDATGIVVADSPPVGAACVPSESAGTYDPGAGEWSVPSLADGASATLTFECASDVVGTFTNTATITASSPGDPNADNDSASATVTVEGVPAVACTTGSPLSFDADGDGGPASVAGDDFSSVATGAFAGATGEFVGIRHEDPAGPPVDLQGCSFVSFDPFAETVIYAAPGGGAVAPDDVFVLATAGGDQALPPGVLPDGPGAFALVEGAVTEGAPVVSVLGRVVAAVVYLSDGDVFGSAGGGADAAARRAGTPGDALAALLATVTEVDLTVSAWPNPTSGRATVAFGLAEAGPARVAVYDALGREVAVLADGVLDVGRHQAALPTRTLPAGAYVVRVTTASEVATARLTVVR